MDRIDSQEDLIERYLLGELSAAEQTALEDEYFGDEFKYDRLCKVEDDLLDRYARGSLPEADRERFERGYLTNPRRRRHVMFAKALARVVDENLTARPARPLQLLSAATTSDRAPSHGPRSTPSTESCS